MATVTLSAEVEMHVREHPQGHGRIYSYVRDIPGSGSGEFVRAAVVCSARGPQGNCIVEYGGRFFWAWE